MAEKYSTGLRDLVLGGKSIRSTFDDFVLDIFGGSVPADADQAPSGTLLCTVTKNSLAVGANDRSIAKQASIDITVAAPGATVIVAVNGVDYTYTVLAEDNTLRKVARKVALMLDDIPQINAIAHATADGDGKLAVKSAIAGASFTIAKGSGGGGGTGTWNLTDNTIANFNSNALQWGAPSGAVIQKPVDVWSGVNVAQGTASYFRIRRPSDVGGTSTTLPRIQGACGTSGAELNLTSINLAKDATTTIGSGQMSLPVG